MNIIIYCRISVDDKCNTIENQLEMGRQYIYNNLKNRYLSKKMSIEEIIDKGYSGSNMDRPGMKRMLDIISYNHNNDKEEYDNKLNIKSEKKVDIIIVKDISRLGRNYIEVGNLINKINCAGIKLIILNKDIDDDLGILLADFYSKDISIKTKSILDMNKRKEKYSLPKVPYGYRKSVTDKYVIEIYEPEAKNVRFIFNKYKEGYKISEIVKLMNLQNNSLDETKNIWNYQKVYRILHNEFYEGTMIYGKSVGHVWEGNRRKNVPKNRWSRIMNHHDKII